MVKIAVAGKSEFVIGFQLAGIREIIELGSSPFSELKNLMTRKDIGIVVVDEKIIDNFEIHQKIDIESSVDPVFIPVSAKAEQDSLRRLIKKSVGVDLWK